MITTADFNSKQITMADISSTKILPSDGNMFLRHFFTLILNIKSVSPNHIRLSCYTKMYKKGQNVSFVSGIPGCDNVNFNAKEYFDAMACSYS